MNNRKTFSLCYFLGRSFFLGFGFSLLSKMLVQDAWIAAILGAFLGSGILYLFGLFKSKLNGKPIKEITSWIKWPILILYFIYNIFIYSQIVFIFQTFASSFFLIKSPVFFIILPIPFIIFRICKTGYPTIAKVAEILMPISIFLTIFGLIGLVQNFKIDYFTPILISKPTNLFTGSLFFAFYSTAPYFLLLNAPIEKNKFVLKYIISSLSIIILCIFIIGILGPNLMQVYRYPEYMAMKKIRIFNFIEKVENIVSIAWLCDSFITLAIVGNNLKETYPTKHQNIYFGITLIILYFWSILSNELYQEGLNVYHILPIILGIFEVLFFLFCLFLPRKKKN